MKESKKRVLVGMSGGDRQHRHLPDAARAGI